MPLKEMEEKLIGVITLPKTNSLPLKNAGFQARNLLFQGSIFSGYVSCREGKLLIWRGSSNQIINMYGNFEGLISLICLGW